MLNAGLPTLLAALSFLLATNFSNPLFNDILGALQALACAAGCLALPTLRDPFHATIAKASLPSRVIAVLGKPPQAQQAPRSPVSLERFTLRLAGGGEGSGSGGGPSSRNLGCLRALIAAAMFLAGTLCPGWFAVPEALQNADYVLAPAGSATLGPNTSGTSGTPSKRSGPVAEGLAGGGQQQRQQQQQQSMQQVGRCTFGRP